MEQQQDAHRAALQAQGWTQRRLQGFIEQAGPLWTRREPEGWAYGLLCGVRHLNPAGVVHGGALMTLADHAISAVAWELCERQPCVTVQMDSHLLTAVRAGDFAQVQPRLTHRTRSLLFMQALVVVNGVPVLSAQAVMKRVGEAG